MKIRRVICISRNPNIQMYESLIELLRLIGDSGFKIEITCPAHEFVEDPVWEHPAVKYLFIRPAERFPRLPMSGKLLLSAMRRTMGCHPSLIIGADRLGSILAAIVAGVTGSPFLYYGLELPQLRQSPASWLTRLEHWSIRRADFVVTMDRHHAEFIVSQTGAESSRIALLPNAVSGSPSGVRSDYLQKRYPACAGRLMVLHAGGIGQAQQSLDLALAAEQWGADRHLVFHAHCRMDNESYFQQFSERVQSLTRVHLNNAPVSGEALDEVISSADIGIAWYDRKALGYRADLLGLAAGKIGRYLRNGVPVIVTNLRTVSEYIAGYRCGVCVDRLEQTGAAIETILGDYERFRLNAIRCYEEVWRPEPYLAAIADRLRVITGD